MHIDIIEKVIRFKNEGKSNREISRILFGRSSKESNIRALIKKFPEKFKRLEKKEEEGKQQFEVETNARELKVLFWDIETSIKRSWHFRQDGYLGSDLIDKDFFIISHAWQWNDGRVNSTAISPSQAVDEWDFDVVLKAWSLLDQADIVIGHNLDKFDIKMINARFLKYGIRPPSPYKTIDTYKLAKRKFGLTFKSLKYLCEYLELDVQKLSHDGVKLWIKATLGDEQSIKDIEVYNRGDIPKLKKVYEKLSTWGTGATNVGFMRSKVEQINALLCPSCGSHDILAITQKAFTSSNAYTAYRCNNCHCISRSNNVKIGNATRLVQI